MPHGFGWVYLPGRERVSLRERERELRERQREGEEKGRERERERGGERGRVTEMLAAESQRSVSQGLLMFLDTPVFTWIGKEQVTDVEPVDVAQASSLPAFCSRVPNCALASVKRKGGSLCKATLVTFCRLRYCFHPHSTRKMKGSW